MEDKTVKTCIDQAERFLALREHNKKELSDKLKNKDFNQDIIEKTIKYLTDNNELSEERYVRSFIRSNNRRHPEGLNVVMQRLALKGADKAVAREVALEMYTEDYVNCLAKDCFEKIVRKTTDVQKIRYKMVQAGFNLSTANFLIKNNGAF